MIQRQKIQKKIQRSKKKKLKAKLSMKMCSTQATRLPQLIVMKIQEKKKEIRQTVPLSILLKVQPNFYHQTNAAPALKESYLNNDAVTVAACGILNSLKERMESRKISSGEYDSFGEQVAFKIRKLNSNYAK
jgi:hypothetical protein